MLTPTLFINLQNTIVQRFPTLDEMTTLYLTLNLLYKIIKLYNKLENRVSVCVRLATGVYDYIYIC